METERGKKKWFRVTFDAGCVMDVEGESYEQRPDSTLVIRNGDKCTAFNPRQWTSICEIDQPEYANRRPQPSIVLAIDDGGWEGLYVDGNLEAHDGILYAADALNAIQKCIGIGWEILNIELPEGHSMPRTLAEAKALAEPAEPSDEKASPCGN